MKAEEATEARQTWRDQRLQSETEPRIQSACKLLKPANGHKTEENPRQQTAAVICCIVVGIRLISCRPFIIYFSSFIIICLLDCSQSDRAVKYFPVQNKTLKNMDYLVEAWTIKYISTVWCFNVTESVLKDCKCWVHKYEVWIKEKEKNSQIWTPSQNYILKGLIGQKLKNTFYVDFKLFHYYVLFSSKSHYK